MAKEEVVRGMKRRLGIAEESVRIKKKRLDNAEQEYTEHRTFTTFSKRLEEKWEQRLMLWQLLRELRACSPRGLGQYAIRCGRLPWWTQMWLRQQPIKSSKQNLGLGQFGKRE